jgi:DNA polymerase III sliding clamp (beta) subunit (PCNA family)
MLINAKNAKALTDCASTDTRRPPLQHILLSASGEGYVDGPALIATDGVRMVAVPVRLQDGEKIEGDTLIPAAALRALKPLPRNRDARLDVNGAVEAQVVGAVARFTIPDDGPYPAVSQVAQKGDAVVTIALNAAFLYEMARAMGTDTVRLEIVKPDTAVRVYPNSGANSQDMERGACGLLMPLRVMD